MGFLTRTALVFAACGALTVQGLKGQEKLRGVELYESKNYQEAAQELKQTVEAKPDDLTARYYLGMALLQMEKNGEAEEQFQAARELLKERRESEPKAAQVELGLARSCMGKKEYDKAREALDRAKELAPEDAEVFMYRGKLEVTRGDYAAAAKELDAALKLNPRLAYAQYYAGIAAANLKRPDKMVEHFQYFLKLAPEAPEAPKVKSYLRSVR